MILLELLWTFLKIGAFTFGGGYAMLPLIQQEVAAHGWLSAAELVNFVAVSESTPGPFAVNIATYVGAETAGAAGAVCATLGVTLPSFIVILIVAGSYERFKNSSAVRGCMSGLRPAVVGLIASAAVSVGKTALFPAGFSAEALLSPDTLGAAAVFALSLLFAAKKLHPIIIICLSAAIGVCLGFAGL